MELSQEEVEKLRKIIRWWDNRRVFDGESSPTIKFDRANSKVTSIRLGGKLYQDAVALAENDPEVKTFNRMVELLLWDKLQKSEEYLAKTTNSD